MALTFHKSDTPNFRMDRRGDLPIDQIVIHVTEGSAESVLDWFGQAKSQVSAHYMVRKNGMIDQFVDEKDEAYHCGRVQNPTAPLVVERPGVNPNYYSIGIEHEGSGKEELTDDQRKSSIMLLRDIGFRRGIPLTRRHVVGHHEIFAAKSCPGVIDVDRLVAEASGKGHAGSPNIPVPQVRWSAFLQDYVIVVREVSNTEWYYVPLKNVGSGQRAKTPLNQMPRTK